MISVPQVVHRMMKGNLFAKNMKKERARENVTQAPASVPSIGNLL
jgi:hypothetical protein